MKIHRAIKWGAFLASTVSLSWFFAGWRQVNAEGRIEDWGLLAAGTLTTILLVMVQGFWIYCDEKAKGRLTKRIALYEKMYEFYKQKNLALVSSDETKERQA
ncbi:MAG: hypothetical protein K2W82_19030 [Candidatus Obscuribacterales bacterium]|nr:hypothetical protein [Candidatus Obscuribacterales bacterium]